LKVTTSACAAGTNATNSTERTPKQTRFIKTLEHIPARLIDASGLSEKKLTGDCEI
jgi:hypothetical protein